MAVKIPHYAEGIEFEMSLDGDAPENQPLEMVKRDGLGSIGWKHKGPTVKGKQTRRFKWVAVGYHHRSVNAVRDMLAPHGDIPEGQWREAVKQMFEPDGQHPRGIADRSWARSSGASPDGVAFFPCVYADGSSGFDWADVGFRGYWLWLVALRE